MKEENKLRPKSYYNTLPHPFDLPSQLNTSG